MDQDEISVIAPFLHKKNTIKNDLSKTKNLDRILSQDLSSLHFTPRDFLSLFSTQLEDGEDLGLPFD